MGNGRKKEKSPESRKEREGQDETAEAVILTNKEKKGAGEVPLQAVAEVTDGRRRRRTTPRHGPGPSRMKRSREQRQESKERGRAENGHSECTKCWQSMECKRHVL